MAVLKSRFLFVDRLAIVHFVLVLLAVLVGVFGCATAALFDAARKNDVERARELLRERGDERANAYNGKGVTPLIEAAFWGHEEMAELLIAAGADVNAGNEKYGMTPLHWAAERGHVHIAQILLRNGADVNVRANDKRTPLHVAAKSGNDTMIMVLLVAGADRALEDASGSHPVDIATRQTDAARAKAKAAREKADRVAASNYSYRIESSPTQSGRVTVFTHTTVTGRTVNGRFVPDDPAEFAHRAQQAEEAVRRWEYLTQLLESP